MKKPKTGRVTVTLTIDRLAVLERMAHKKGVAMPTFCRVLLSEIADTEKKTAGNMVRQPPKLRVADECDKARA